MKQEMLYGSLCAEVYDLRVPTIERNAYEFYKSFIIDTKNPILEPMCGTGRFLLPFAQEGFNIEGFDASTHMIDKLYQKAYAQNLKVNAWVCNTDQLIQRNNHYGLIFIPFSSFGLIIDQDKILITLKKFFRNLEPEGRLVFEVDTLSTQLLIDQTNLSRYLLSDGKTINVKFSDLPVIDDIMSCSVTYELLDNDNVLKTEIEEYKLKLYDIKMLTNTLKDIGFCEIKIHKPFFRNTLPDKDDSMVIFECQK